jgi:hypothetical protein
MNNISRIRNTIAIMIDSPYHAYDQTRFAITEAGIQDVQEHKSTGSER